MSVRLEELVGGDPRGGRAPQARACRWRSSSARPSRAARGAAVRRGAGAPGHLADRRAQAPLAVGRRRSARARAAPRSCSAYERGGAAALSVLTEEAHFGGSLDDLREARAATELPILRKDFTVDPYQLYEAKAAGRRRRAAGGRRAARRASWPSSTARPATLDLDAIVEIHDDDELEAALEIDADVIGINNRDLEDFSVDIQRTFDLLADVPAGKTVVSESGIVYREQIEELERVGVDAVLVGETLMRAPRPRGRGARAGPRRGATQA